MFLIDLFGAAPITRSAFNNIHGSSAELIVYFIPVKPDPKPEDHLLSATCLCRVSSDDNICHQPNRGVFLQFWQHTGYLKKSHPFVESTIVTPSSHRVHHGSDEKYLDRNFGAPLVVWNKLFKITKSKKNGQHMALRRV
jgi:hypothetical protein